MMFPKIDNTVFIRAQKQGILDQSVALYIFRKELVSNGMKTLVVSPVEFVELKQPSYEDVPPTVSVPYETAQYLMDNLWDCGFRPSEGSGSAGALLATQNHLKDLQDVVKRLFGIVEGGKHDG